MIIVSLINLMRMCMKNNMDKDETMRNFPQNKWVVILEPEKIQDHI